MMLARGGGRLFKPAARSLAARNAAPSPAGRVLPRAYTSVLSSRRSYATTTRATKPTSTVKKAVKDKAAAKKPASKKKAAPAKKPAAKTKAKTTAKKPAAKKAAPKKPARKVLTPEQKRKAELRSLRAKALKEPTSNRSLSAYNVFVAERTKADKASLADVSKTFKDLSPAQIEHYNHLAAEKTVAKRAEYKAWVHSHTPDQIRIANNARNLLRKRLANFKSRPAHTEKLVDDRHVAIPNAYNRFFQERFAGGDMKGIKVTEAAKLIANEWKALDANEKKRYQDEEKAARAKVAA